jgi:hypothetical protein
MPGQIALRTERVLSVLPWNTCNAQCAHCGPRSGPDDHTSIDHTYVLKLIQEAARIYGRGWCLTLSGGEIFLHYDRLLEYVRAANAAGGYTTAISNGFWATSVEHGVSLLRPLAELGLRAIAFSADRFHSPFVPFDRIRNGIRGALSLRIEVEVRSVATREGRLSDVLLELQEADPWFVRFMEIPLIPDGRARSLPRGDLLAKARVPEGTCPASSMTINPAGSAMACCNGAGMFPDLQVGTIYDYSLEQLEYLFAANPIINYLANRGPASCLEFLEPADAEELTRQCYVDVCHLCIELFADDRRSARVRSGIEARFNEALARAADAFGPVSVSGRTHG